MIGSRRLILMRHGESTANRDGMLTGRIDCHLTACGKRQAERASRFISKRFGSLDELYSSPLKRASETARIIAEKLRVPVREDELLVEMDFGRWEGRPKEELISEPEWSNYVKDPFHFNFPGGETPQDAKRRIELFRQKLFAQGNWQTVMVVSHYTPIVFLILGVLENGDASRAPFSIDNASLSVIHVTGGSCFIELLNYIP